MASTLAVSHLLVHRENIGGRQIHTRIATAGRLPDQLQRHELHMLPNDPVCYQFQVEEGSG